MRTLITRTLEFEFERMPYRLDNLSARKLLTLARAELSTVTTNPRPPQYPSQLQIEVSGVCTLRCPLCASGKGIIGSKHGLMSLETYRSLIDEAGDAAVIAILWMWGEPLMNPRFPEMVAIARRKNLATVTSTNGQHVQTREEAEALVGSGLDNLIVAVDGATQESYSRYRVGGDLEKITRCLDLIAQAKRTLGSDKPGVNVRAIVMQQNEHELPEIERMAREHGADMFSTKVVCTPDYCGEETADRFAPADSRYKPFEFGEGRANRCRRPWSRLSVTWDGTVLPCEFDFNRSASFGHGGRSFLDTWRGQAADSFRRRFLQDRDGFPFCSDCPYRDHNPRECMVEMKRL